MKLVLLSGGSGKRLWPLSNDSRSKQFLKVLKGPGNQLESMVQRVWRQLEEVGMARSAVIATSKVQTDMIQNQIGSHVPLIVEPERRDTFPAIALAAAYLYSVQRINTEETVCVLPVDPYVETAFFYKIRELERVLTISRADLALIGVRPTFPSSKYGYIVPERVHSADDFVRVGYFQEKPSIEQAKKLIEQHALWNGGVFAFQLERFLSFLTDKGLPTQYEALLQQYRQLPKISFDYEVVEKMKEIVTLPYHGNWKDLGTWNTLTEEMAMNQIGKGIISEDSVHTHLVNELDIPITVLGVPNAVVAASPDGILVTDKQASPRVKSVMKDFKQRPMYEERCWGWYRVLDQTTYDGQYEVLARRIGLNAGRSLGGRVCHGHRKVWTFVKGAGTFVLNGEIQNVELGDMLQISERTTYELTATTDMEWIEVNAGVVQIEERV